MTRAVSQTERSQLETPTGEKLQVCRIILSSCRFLPMQNSCYFIILPFFLSIYSPAAKMRLSMFTCNTHLSFMARINMKIITSSCLVLSLKMPALQVSLFSHYKTWSRQEDNQDMQRAKHWNKAVMFPRHTNAYTPKEKVPVRYFNTSASEMKRMKKKCSKDDRKEEKRNEGRIK